MRHYSFSDGVRWEFTWKFKIAFELMVKSISKGNGINFVKNFGRLE